MNDEELWHELEDNCTIAVRDRAFEYLKLARDADPRATVKRGDPNWGDFHVEVDGETVTLLFPNRAAKAKVFDIRHLASGAYGPAIPLNENNEWVFTMELGWDIGTLKRCTLEMGA